MAGQLEHRQIQATLMSLADAKIVNLDAPIRSMLEPVGKAMSASGVGGEAAFHILCCSEYAIVTGLTADRFPDVNPIADAIRSALGPAGNR